MPILNGKDLKDPNVRKSMLDDIVKLLQFMEKDSKKRLPEKAIEKHFIDGQTWTGLRNHLVSYGYSVTADMEDFKKGLTIGDCLDKMSVFKA